MQKVVQIFSDDLGYFVRHHLPKNTVVKILLWLLFGHHLDTFRLFSLQHLVTLNYVSEWYIQRGWIR